MVLIGAACGAILGLGVVLVVLGLRGSPPSERRRRPLSERPRWLVQAAVAFAAAAAMLLLTGWPVGALLAGLVAVVVPGHARTDAAGDRDRRPHRGGGGLDRHAA